MGGEMRYVDEDRGELIPGEDIVGRSKILVLYFFHQSLKSVSRAHCGVIEADEEFFNRGGLQDFFLDVDDDNPPG